MFGARWTQLGICILGTFWWGATASACDQPDCPHTPLYSRQATVSYVEDVLDLVEACIRFDDRLMDKAPLNQLALQLRNTGWMLECGGDDLRVKYVSTQGIIEHVLSCALARGEITDLVGVIHTPCPATPLCTVPFEDPTEGLLDPSIAEDAQKKLTVRSRAQILRDYLHLGGHLFVTYPESGIQRRSLDQLSVYQDLVANFPNHLHDWPLHIDSLDPDMIGATYLFRTHDGHTYAFSIKARQTNQPTDESEWGMWLGLVSSPVIAERIDRVEQYLHAVGGPEWMNERIQGTDK